MVHYQNGNSVAFEILFRRHSLKVFQYFRKRSSSEIASDLLQDVFMKVHKARAQYSRQYPFLPWLFAISKNAFFDFLKKSRVETVTFESQGFELPTATPGNVGLELNLAAAIKELPINQRRVIELRYLNEWSFEEIAKDIKTSPENVRQIVSRGIAKIRKNMSKKA
jgi:RNA polymerase sigma-70 factor (ECF subfamily)